MKDKWRVVEKELRAQGWTLNLTANGHVRCVPPDPERPLVIVATTSGDPRALNNNIRDLKRGGYVPGRLEPVATSPTPASQPEPDSEPALSSSHSALKEAFEATFGQDLLPDTPIGLRLRRTDRVDPRDPKLIVGCDLEGKVVHLRDRHMRKLDVALRIFDKDMRKGHYAIVEDDDDYVPDVSQLTFGEALFVCRERQDLSTRELSHLIGLEDGKTLRSWEQNGLYPTAAQYLKLLELFPLLKDAPAPPAAAAHGPPDRTPDSTAAPDSMADTQRQPQTPPPRSHTLQRTITNMNEGAFRHATKALRDAGHGDLADALEQARSSPPGQPADEYITLTWELSEELHGGIDELRLSKNKKANDAWHVEGSTKHGVLLSATAACNAPPSDAFKGALQDLAAEMTRREEALRKKRQRVQSLFGGTT